jgi:hypothetical protein
VNDPGERIERKESERKAAAMKTELAQGTRAEEVTIRRGGEIYVDDVRIILQGSFLKIAGLEAEWYGEVREPEAVIRAIRGSTMGADIFTFCQRLPETEPKFSYRMEWESVAAIPIQSYDKWLNEQINAGARKAIRKAEKKGVKVRVVPFDDAFVHGLTSIVNETPIRQGRPYQHYGKDLAAVREEFSKDSDRCDFVGAYYGSELIGFIKLFRTPAYTIPFGMVSKIAHRDKSPQNALLSKAIELCAEKKLQYLLYGQWSAGGLGDFKQNNGCVRIDVPRYYVPLTLRGTIGLRLNLHRGFAEALPPVLKSKLIAMRSRWHARRSGGPATGASDSGNGRLTAGTPQTEG